MYKVSKYILKEKINEDEYLIDNLSNGTLICVSKSEYDTFNEIFEDPNSSKWDGNEIYLQAKELGFIIPSHINELNISKYNHWKERCSKEQLSLTIIPTFLCNCECEYCFEKGMRHNVMPKVASDKIIKFIECRLPDIKFLSISWFGGEPLLCLDVIQYMSKKIIDLCQNYNVKYESQIATNSYLINDEIIKVLKKINIRLVETTLGGTKEFHDKMRCLKNGQPTFDTIISNIKKEKKSFRVMININVTKTNVDSMFKLIDFLKESGLDDDNVYITLNPVELSTNNKCEYLYLPNDIYIKRALEIFNYALDKGLHICDITKFNSICMYCATDYENSFTFDPNGAVYKCAERFTKDNQIGALDDDGILVRNGDFKFELRDSYNESKCKECSIMPYCNGGCKNKKDKNEDYCPGEKDYILDYLKLFYKRQLFENR